MGKRLFRIRSGAVATEVGTLIGTIVDLVLVNNRTLHGRLLEVTPPTVVLRDNIGHRHTVTITEIEEIIFDRESAF